MGLINLSSPGKVGKLEKEVKELQDENMRLKEARKRCVECENFDKRRNFAEETKG